MSPQTWRYKKIKRKPKLSYWNRPTENSALRNISVLPPHEMEQLIDELAEMQKYTHDNDYSRQTEHISKRINAYMRKKEQR